MNNNCQECNFSMESLFPLCNKPFHFCSKDTNITFLPVNFQNKKHVNSNFSSNGVALVMSSFTNSYAFCSKWLTQIFVDCNRLKKG